VSSATTEEADAVVIQTDGKIVIAGGTDLQADFKLMRFNADGSVDSTFGSGGQAAVSFSAGLRSEYARAVKIQPDGKIIAAGISNQGGSVDNYAVARLDTNGILDSSFGTGGKVLTSFTGFSDSAFSVMIQSDGKIVTAGTANGAFGLVRYNADGTLDASFGSGGKVVTSFNGFQSADASAAVLQSDGKIILAGKASTASQSLFALARFNPDGSPDGLFGAGGQTTTNFNGMTDRAAAVVLQADNKIVTAGTSLDGSNYVFAVARYLGDGITPTTHTVSIPTGAASCSFDPNSACAYTPNPLTIQSGDSVHWNNEPTNLHTATSDDSGNSTAVIQPVAPANAFSTELMFPGAASTVIGPFNTAVDQT
jgi:uncharacterized delta-60 repeat protein